MLVPDLYFSVSLDEHARLVHRRDQFVVTHVLFNAHGVNVQTSRFVFTAWKRMMRCDAMEKSHGADAMRYDAEGLLADAMRYDVIVSWHSRIRYDAIDACRKAMRCDGAAAPSPGFAGLFFRRWWVCINK